MDSVGNFTTNSQGKGRNRCVVRIIGNLSRSSQKSEDGDLNNFDEQERDDEIGRRNRSEKGYDQTNSCEKKTNKDQHQGKGPKIVSLN